MDSFVGLNLFTYIFGYQKYYMIDAMRLTLSEDITYENVSIAVPAEHQQFELPEILANHIWFRHGKKWMLTTVYDIHLIQLSTEPKKVPGGIPFERLILDGDKIYDHGHIICDHLWADYGIQNILHSDLESQVVFACKEGVFVTTDYSITVITFSDGQVGKNKPKCRCARG